MEEPIKAQRTYNQNRALYLWCQKLSDALNDAGLDQRKVLKPTYSIPWTKQAIHDHIWIPLQKAMYGTESTIFLHKIGQIDMIRDTIMRMLGEKWELEDIPWPVDAELQYNKLKK